MGGTEERSGSRLTAGPVVVGVDGSPSAKAALAWAARYARLSGARLVVAAAWDYPTGTGWGGAMPIPEDYDPEASARDMVGQMMDETLGDSPAQEVSAEIVRGHPAPILTELSKTASLVVVGSRGHGAFAGMLIGSVSEFVATHAHCPVVVVRDG